MSRLRRNVIANYLGGAWAALMGIAFVPLYIQYLGVEAYGLIGLYIALQAWMVLLDMGFTPTLNREMARMDAGERSPLEARSLLRSLELVYLPICVVCVLVAYALAPRIAADWLEFDQLSIAEVADALLLIGVTVTVRWYSTLYRGAVLGLQRQVWLNATAAAFATLRGAGVLLVLAFWSDTIQAFFLFQCAGFLLESLVLRNKVDRLVPPAEGVRFSVAELAGVMRFAIGVATINALAGMLTQLDKFVLSAALPLEVLGHYTLASTVAGALYIAIAPVSNAAFPRFTGACSAGDQDRLAIDYRGLSQVIGAVILPLGLFLSTFSLPLLYLWTGDAGLSASSAPLLSILALGSMLNGVMVLPYVLQLASGWTRLALTLNAIAVIAYVPVVYPLIREFGAIAPAAFWVLLNIFYVLVAVPLMHRRLLPGEAVTWYRQSLLLPLAAAALVCIAARYGLEGIAIERNAAGLTLLAVVLALAVAAATLITPEGRHLAGRYLLRQGAARSVGST